MYVAITGKGKSKVVQFCEQHRIAKTNKKKTVVIKTIGNYETLLKENPNIILELKEEAKRLNTPPYLKKCTTGIYNGLVSFIYQFESSRGFIAKW